jgi:undecaprenyl diphosphate synthase
MNEMKTLHGEGARLRVIGDRENLPDDIVRLIDRAEELTVHNDRIAVTIALSYGSHSEIVSATKALAMKVAAGEMSVDDIDEVSFAGELMTYDLPPLDLLIRTSGEIRLSNFLLWQAAYSELVFVDTLWPDFDKATFKEALAEYAGRQRRFGATQPMDAAL